MIAAAMDLGSNTLRLLVAEAGDGRIQGVLARELASPRLGRGLVAGRALDPRAKTQAWEDARRFNALARELGAARVALGATQACRLAADGADFVARLGRELGLEQARVLSGQEEARLSRLGVLGALAGPVQGALLADVGGGSTELVDLGDQEAGGLSLPVGAVSLSEAHLRHDPPTPQELDALAGAVGAALEPAREIDARRLVATAGTASTLASLALGLDDYQPERINNLGVDRAELERIAARLAALPLEARRRAMGPDPARADIIIAGLAVLKGLLDLLHLDELTTMDAGLLEGILLDDLRRL